MSELTRRTFVRLGLGLGAAGLALTRLPEFLVQMPGQVLALGLQQIAALEQAISSGAIASVPLRLEYLGAVRMAADPAATLHYHVYQTTEATSQQTHGVLYMLAAEQPVVEPRALPEALHPNTPGRLSVQIQPFASEDPRYQRRLEDGRMLTNGTSLAALRELFGGSRGIITDPALGKRHTIDLSPWLHEHPHQTYLNIAFYFQPA